MANDTQRRISLATPNLEALNLLAESHSSAPSGPPSWRRFQYSNQRQVIQRQVQAYGVPAAIVLILLLAFLLFEVKVEFGAKSRACPEKPKDEGASDFALVDVSNEPVVLDDTTWKGYETYLRKVEGLMMDPVQQSQHYKVAGRGPYGFAHFSSYRTGPNSFTMVGFGARVLRDYFTRSVRSCWWEDSEDNSTNWGQPTIYYSEEPTDLTYDTIIIQCFLERATGSKGGKGMATIDSETINLYREKDTEEHLIHPPPIEQLPHFISVCTPSLRSGVEPRMLVEYLEYHRHLGIGHFILYDGGAFDSLLAQSLEEYLTQGIVEVVPFREVKKFALQEEGTHLALHDCLYRSRMKSRWVMWSDWDEYLFVPPKTNVRSILDSHKESPWLSHGAIIWSPNLCRTGPPLFGSSHWSYNQKVPFAIERMVFRWPHIVCHGSPAGIDPNFCPANTGERKYFFDPRQVHTLHMYSVGVTEPGGQDLSFTEIHHWRFPLLHFQGNFSLACSQVYKDEDVVEWWVRDNEQARYTRYIREGDYPPT